MNEAFAALLEIAAIISAIPAAVLETDAPMAPPSRDAALDPEGDDYAFAREIKARVPLALQEIRATVETLVSDERKFAASGVTATQVGKLVIVDLSDSNAPEGMRRRELRFARGSRSFVAALGNESPAAEGPAKTAFEVSLSGKGQTRKITVSGGTLWHGGSATKSPRPMPRYYERRGGDIELVALSAPASGVNGGEIESAFAFRAAGSSDNDDYDSLMRTFLREVAGTDVCAADEAPRDVDLGNGTREPFNVCSRLFEASLLSAGKGNADLTSLLSPIPELASADWPQRPSIHRGLKTDSAGSRSKGAPSSRKNTREKR